MYNDVIRDRSIVTLNRNQVRVLETNLQASRDRFEVGDLTRTDDTLAASYDQVRAMALDMLAYCRRLEVPVGFNVESVSTRKVEIEAAVRLAGEVRSALRR